MAGHRDDVAPPTGGVMRKGAGKWDVLGLALLAMLAVGARSRGGPAPRAGALTLGQLRALAARVGFPDVALAAAVAMAESGGVPDIRGDGGASIGLWQVHTPSWPMFDPVALTDPEYNARAALTISKAGTDWSPWTTYTSGAYRRYMGASA